MFILHFFKLNLLGIGMVVALVFQIHFAEAGERHQYTLGIFPYVSPAQLVKFHSPLRIKFEEVLGKPVSLVSAPSFKKFVKRTKLMKYDFILTAPHLGRLAEVRDKYQPIVHTSHKVQGLYLVPKESPIKSLSDLKGKTISSVGRAAIITQMAMEQLTEKGSKIGVDVNFVESKNFNSSMYAPLRGETDASMTGIVIWNKITKDAELKKKMRVVGETKVAPGFMIMAKEDVDKSVVTKVMKELSNFHNTNEGKAYVDATGFYELKVSAPDVMKKLDPYIQIFLRAKKDKNKKVSK